MSRIRFTLAVCALVATVSACQDGGSVTGPDRGPGGARHNLGWAGSGHFAEPTDSVFGGIGMAGSGYSISGIGAGGSGHYVEGDGGIGMAGSGHAVATNNGGMAGSGGESTTSDSVIVTLYGIGMMGTGH
jgi:hypothetical protein